MRLSTVHRSSDVLAKTRDNEFCLLLQNTYWDLCRPVADRTADIASSLAVEHREHVIRPVFSIGILNFPYGDEAVSYYLDGAQRIHYATIGDQDQPPPPAVIV